MNKKFGMEKSLSGVAFTDELHSDLGSAAVSLMDTNEVTGHDYIRSGLFVRTAPAGAGTLLEEGTDYVLANENTTLSAEASAALGSTVQCYKTIQITNVTYQSGDLYFTGYYHGDAVSATRENKNKMVVVEYAASGTTDNATYGDIIEECTGGTAGIRRKTPNATLCKNKRITYRKTDSGYGPICILNDHSQTYNGMSYLFLFFQNDSITVISNGVNWIVEGTLFFPTGGQNSNDTTNRELGFMTFSYDGKVGTPLIGEAITQSNGIKGVIIYDSGTALILLNVTGLGYATNDLVWTGAQSGATVTANNGGTTKNADQSCRHGTGLPAWRFEVELWVFEGATFSWTNAKRVGRFYSSDGSYIANWEEISIDTNYLKVQTGTTGEFVITESGSYVLYDSDDYSFNVILKVVF